jgi:hypothetical protein
MDTSGFFEDLLYLVQHIHVEPDVAVRRWTHIDCRDYQVPLALIAGMLTGFDLPNWSEGLKLRDTPEHRAVGEIVNNSRLAVLLEVDADGQRIRYRDTLPALVKEDVARFIGRNSSGCTK